MELHSPLHKLDFSSLKGKVRIGSGGQGIVYKAKHIGECVAVKVMLIEAGLDKINAVANLAHPNIVRIM